MKKTVKTEKPEKSEIIEAIKALAKEKDISEELLFADEHGALCLKSGGQRRCLVYRSTHWPSPPSSGVEILRAGWARGGCLGGRFASASVHLRPLRKVEA